MSDITVYHVTFHEGGVEITYGEDYEQSDRVAQQRTIAIPLEVASVDINEALDSLQAVVDQGLVYLDSFRATGKGPERK